MPSTPPSQPPVRIVPRTLRWYHYLLAKLLAGFIHCLHATLRYRVSDQTHMLKPPTASPQHGVIFCFWHNRLALAATLRPGYLRSVGRTQPLAALISASKDGGILAQVFRSFDITPVRGSSSRRGHQALRELTTLARQGYDLAITPDGPRGPRYKLQDGVIALASVTGFPIVPLTLNYSNKLALNSWDRFQLPLPFARCEITFGSPIAVPRRTDNTERERLRQHVEDTLLAMTRD